MKTCRTCRETKPLSEFYTDKTSADGRRSNCKECQKSASNVSYLANRDAINARRSERSAARAAENYARIVELKNAPCADCGGTFPPVCMDFDHLPGEDKVAHVSRMIWHRPWDEIAAEIAKCELVCANCHRLRTFLRGQSWHSETARDALGGVV